MKFGFGDPPFPSLKPRPRPFRYPTWAPAALIALGKHFPRRAKYPPLSEPTPKSLVGLESLLLDPLAMQMPLDWLGALIDTLCTDERMARVWRSLDRKSATYDRCRERLNHPKRRAFNVVPDAATHVFLKCGHIVADWQRLPRLTAKERKLRYVGIERLTDQLHKFLQEEIDLSCEVADEVAHGLLVPPYSTMDGKPLPSPIELGVGKKLFRDDFQNVPPRVIESRLAPLVTWFLFEGVLQVGRTASAYARRPPVMPKPHAKRAPAQFFASELVDYFEDYFGSPLHEHAADITSVITGIECDRTAVRALMRDKPKRDGHR